MLELFPKIQGDINCTNTRLVCTHFNVFFLPNPNMVIKIWISFFFFFFFFLIENFGLSSAFKIREERILRGDNCIRLAHRP